MMAMLRHSRSLLMGSASSSKRLMQIDGLCDVAQIAVVAQKGHIKINFIIIGYDCFILKKSRIFFNMIFKNQFLLKNGLISTLYNTGKEYLWKIEQENL
jgi:hypothetical protein